MLIDYLWLAELRGIFIHLYTFLCPEFFFFFCNKANCNETNYLYNEGKAVSYLKRKTLWIPQTELIFSTQISSCVPSSENRTSPAALTQVLLHSLMPFIQVLPQPPSAAS